MTATVKQILDTARGWLGYNEKDGSFKEILDLYNSHKPLARGYAIKYTDEWCSTFVSAVAIKAGATDIIPTEVGCEPHITLFKNMGIWIEDGTIIPLPGDIILFNLGSVVQPNDDPADHIGYVEDVKDGNLVCIEGNKGEAVARRTLKIGDGIIRGFARPKYETEQINQNESQKQEEVHEMPDYLERKYKYCDSNIPLGLQGELQEAIDLKIVNYSNEGFDPPLSEQDVRTLVWIKRGVSK